MIDTAVQEVTKVIAMKETINLEQSGFFVSDRKLMHRSYCTPDEVMTTSPGA